MRWTLHRQILWPLVLIQSAALALLALGAGGWSLYRLDRDVHQRLDELARTLEQSQYPLTESVLSQLRGLSGAEFIVADEADRLRVATLPDAAPLLEQLRAEAPLNAAAGDLDWRGQQFLTRTVPTTQHAPAARIDILYPTILLQAARRDALWPPLLLTVLSLTFSVWAASRVATRWSGRVAEIERRVAEVAEGDFRPIPLPPRDDELRSLSASVNRLATDLAAKTEQIRQSERTLLLKRIVGGIAHQLRNSITGARMAVQVHQRRCNISTDNSLSVALKQLSLTEELIRGVASLLREQPIVAAVRPRPLLGVIEEAMELLQPVCDHQHITFSLVDVDEDAAGRLIADGDQVRSALVNLCLNAVEASGPGGQVQLVCQARSGNLMEIEVRDNGPGLPEAWRDQAFEAFATTKPQGMGLGLALVKALAESSGGAVAYSRRDGWSCFQLTLPAMNPPELPPAESTFLPPKPSQVELMRTTPEFSRR